MRVSLSVFQLAQCLLCMFSFHPLPSIRIPDLVADGTVVIGIHDSNLHCGASHIQTITGCNVEQIPILLLPIQQTTHVNLPLSLHEGQAENAPRVSPCRSHRREIGILTQQGKE